MSNNVAKRARLIRRRYSPILLLTLISLSSLLFQLDGSPEVSAQPPYYPLEPISFKVVKTAWGTTTTEIDAAPGDKNIPLIVTIQNMSNSTVTGLTETLILQQPFTNRSLGYLARSYYEGSLSPGSTSSAQFILNIDRRAAPGEYVLGMRINYLTIVSGVGSTLYIAQETEAKVPVLIAGTHYIIIYDVIVSPEQVSPGGNFTISGSVVDTATASSFYNTNVSFSSPVFLKGIYVFIGQIDPNIPRPFSATLDIQRSLPNGTYQGEILVTYLDSLNVIHVSSAVVKFQVQRQAPTIPTRPSQSGGPLQIIIDFLWRIFQFFFGSSAATIWTNYFAECI